MLGLRAVWVTTPSPSSHQWVHVQIKWKFKGFFYKVENTFAALSDTKADGLLNALVGQFSVRVDRRRLKMRHLFRSVVTSITQLTPFSLSVSCARGAFVPDVALVAAVLVYVCDSRGGHGRAGPTQPVSCYLFKRRQEQFEGNLVVCTMYGGGYRVFVLRGVLEEVISGKACSYL